MIRILIDGCIYGTQAHGGIGRYFTEMLTRLGAQGAGFDFLFHLNCDQKGELPKASQIKLLKRWESMPQWLLKSLWKNYYRAKILAFQPHIFHSTYYTPPYWKALKTVVTVHDFIDEHFFRTMSGNRVGFIEHKRKMIEQADAVIAVSKSAKNDILTYTDADPGKISVIYHGVNGYFKSSVSDLDIDKVNSFRSDNGINGPYWLFVGRRTSYKNFSTLLRAWALLDEVHRLDTWLVAVGPDDGLEQWQIDFLVKHRLENRLILLSRVEDRLLKTAYQGAQAFIFPSLYEGFGIPLLEAMACGTPLIISDMSAFHEVAGEAAKYFDPHDAEMLADQMQQMLDHDMRHFLIHKGKQRVDAFSWEQCADRHANLYKALV